MNNTGRTLTFVILSTIVLMTSIFLQNLFFPQVPADIAQQQANAEANALEVAPEGETTTDENADEDTPATESESPALTSNDSANEDSESENANPTATEGEASEPETAKTELASESTPSETNPQGELLTLGSADPASGYRFLVTLNSEGASVRRVELNAQTPKGRYEYREINAKGGYLGQLDCVDDPAGCLVRVVGEGTPAAAAGIQAGDIITSLTQADGKSEAVANADDFKAQLAKTKPRQSISLELKRDGSSQSVSVALTDAPVEIIRPEPGTLDPEYDFPESFLFTLRKYESSLDWAELAPAMRTANWKSKVVDKTAIARSNFHM